MYILRSQINDDADDPSYNTYYEDWANVAVSDKEIKLLAIKYTRLTAIVKKNNHITALQNLYDSLMRSDPIPYIPAPTKELLDKDKRKYFAEVTESFTKNKVIRGDWHLNKWLPVLVHYCNENDIVSLLKDSDIVNGKILPELLPTFVIEEIDSV